MENVTVTVTFEKVSEKTITEKQFLMTVDYAGKEADIDPDEDMEDQVEGLMKNYKDQVAQAMQAWCKEVSTVEKVATFDPESRTITIINQKMIL